MRQRIVQTLRQDPGVSALVGDRVYIGRGALGGISREETPEAFDQMGDVLASIVVRLETRSADPERPQGRDALVAQQIIGLYVYDQRDYDRIFAVVRAIRTLLHQPRPIGRLKPVSDPVIWTDTAWFEDTAEQIDQSLNGGTPVVTTRFVATIRELNTQED